MRGFPLRPLRFHQCRRPIPRRFLHRLTYSFRDRTHLRYQHSQLPELPRMWVSSGTIPCLRVPSQVQVDEAVELKCRAFKLVRPRPRLVALPHCSLRMTREAFSFPVNRMLMMLTCRSSWRTKRPATSSRKGHNTPKSRETENVRSSMSPKDGRTCQTHRSAILDHALIAVGLRR